MKSRFLKIGFCIVILVSLVAASFALVRPIYRQIGKKLNAKVAVLNSTLDKSFGINVSYSSLSPSILTGINLKGIVVKDTKTDEKFLTIKKITAKYSLESIIKGDFDNAISEIIINDVQAEIIYGKNASWLDYCIQTYFEKEKENKSDQIQQENKFDKKTLLEIIEDPKFNIQLPCNINFNNVSLIYKNSKKDINAKAEFRKFYAEKTLSAGKFAVELIGSFSGNVKKNTFSTNLFFQCSLLSKLNNSSAVVQFYNSSFNSYSVRQLGFLSEYSNAIFSLKMLPTVQNVYIQSNTNLKTHDINLRFDSNNFKISHLVKGFKKGTSASTISSLLISANANVDYNYKSKKIKYNSSGDIFVPENILRGTLDLSYAVSGDKNYINIPFFNAIGERVDVSYSGGVNIRSIQPEGVLSVNKIQLENGGIITSEFFIEPLKKGFIAFSPVITFDEKIFTAAQLDFIPQSDGFDFDFEVYDNAHSEKGELGHLFLTGNYLTASKFLQSNLNLDGMYIDSLLETVSFFMDKNAAGFVKDSAPIFKNTIFSTSIYLTSYDNNFSYSIPSAIIADTTSDSKMLMLALDGNSETLQLSRFELVLNDQNIIATAHAESIREASSLVKQVILSGQVEYNQIPYGFSGLINKDWIEISGDYGLYFSFLTDNDTDSLLGSFAMADFPIKFKDSTLSISADTNFTYNIKDKINLSVNQFLFKSIDGVSDVEPVFAFTGNVNKTGVYFEQIGYVDDVTNLTGDGFVMWNFYDADFLGASCDIQLLDSLYNEKVSIKGEVANPENIPFSTKTFLNNYYVSAEIILSGFRTGRFFGDRQSSDSLNANISVTGILTNPFVAISVPRGALTYNEKPLTFSVQATVMDREFELENSYVKWGETQINDIVSKISFNEWKGFVSMNTETVILDKTLYAPAKISFSGLRSDQNEKGIPKTFEIDIVTDTINGTFISTPQAVAVHIVKMSDEVYITSSENLGLTADISANGELNAKIDNKLPFKMKIQGNTKHNADLRFYDINLDLAKLTKEFAIPIVKVYSGKVTGEFKITGPKDDRGFDGLLAITPGDFTLPSFFTNRAKTDVIYLAMTKDLMYTPRTRCMVKRSPVDVTVNIQFKKMMFDNFSVLVETVGETYAPININLNQVHVKGSAQVNLEVYLDNSSMTVTGGIVAKDANAEFGTSTLTDVVSNMNKDNNETSNTEVMLDITMKNRVQVFYSSFVRGLVVPDSQVKFAYSARDNKMTLDGGVPLRSGEIIYLNSSFYIKEGRIDFSENDDGLNPYITARAETRERDKDNNEIKILLEIDHQKINNLAPRLTSTPARSEKEILELLGSFVSANSNSMSSFMLATGDYALQTMVVRKIENALRDFLNFDILSIRTMVVQNAVKYSVAPISERQGMNISNFFDNTTVYIGKYFGGNIYADALVRLVYDKNRINDSTTLQGIIFKPEFGIEMESPIANIRWSLAPDLSDFTLNRIMIIPALTLSWKFNY